MILGQFVLYKVARTWEDARQKCIQLGGDLASIGTAVEAEIVNERFEASVPGIWIWVGLNDTVTEGQFAWCDGTTSMGVQWDTLQPNGGIFENCGCYWFTTGRFHDAGCLSAFYYICEFN